MVIKYWVVNGTRQHSFATIYFLRKSSLTESLIKPKNGQRINTNNITLQRNLTHLKSQSPGFLKTLKTNREWTQFMSCEQWQIKEKKQFLPTSVHTTLLKSKWRPFFHQKIWNRLPAFWRKACPSIKRTQDKLVSLFSVVLLYITWKRGLPWKFAHFVLFHLIKKRSFNLLCVFSQTRIGEG